MIRLFALLSVATFMVACTSNSEVRMASEPIMTPESAARMAAEAKFVVNTPVNAVTKGDGPEKKYLWAIETFLKSKLEENQRLADDSNGTMILDIKITDWRLRGGATREIFGVLAGKDGIVSEVSVHDTSGQNLGMLSVVTYNITAFGGETVVQMHGEEIATQLLEKLQALEAAGS